MMFCTEINGQSSTAKIDDFMKSFQKNIKGMEGLKNTFFSSDCRDVINIKSENVIKIDDYIKSNFFKKLDFVYSGGFWSCKNESNKFYYVYTYESSSKKSVTFELTSDFKIRTIITQNYKNMLSVCKNDGGENLPHNQNPPQPPPSNNQQPNQPNQENQSPNFQQPNQGNKPPNNNQLPNQTNKPPICPPCKASDELVEKNQKAKNSIDSINDKQNKLRDTLRLTRDTLTIVKDSARINKDSLVEITKNYKKLNDCITLFCDSVKNQLDKANEAYELYKEFKTRDTVRKKAYFNEAWGIYKSIYYDNIPNSVCFLAKKDCLGKNPQACTNISNILVFNREKVVEELGDDLTEQLNRRTEMILSSLSLVIRDGNNVGRTEALRNLESLPRVLFQEKSSTTEGAKDMLRDIKTDYENGEFSSSLSKFDRLYYLLSLDEFKKIGDAVLDAKYCAGIILLWELADTKTIDSWIIPDSWLKKNQYAQSGSFLLSEILEETKNDTTGKYEKMRKEIKYALSKNPSLAK